MTARSRAARVAPLAAAFSASDLVQCSFAEGDFAVELFRQRSFTAPSQAVPVPAAYPAHEGTGTAAETTTRLSIRADLVGIVHFREPALASGMRFESATEIATIEALGVRTPVRVDAPGILTEVLVQHGSPVEFGQLLFVIERV